MWSYLIGSQIKNDYQNLCCKQPPQIIVQLHFSTLNYMLQLCTHSFLCNYGSLPVFYVAYLQFCLQSGKICLACLHLPYVSSDLVSCCCVMLLCNHKLHKRKQCYCKWQEWVQEWVVMNDYNNKTPVIIKQKLCQLMLLNSYLYFLEI